MSNPDSKKKIDNTSDLFGQDNPEFLEALEQVEIPQSTKQQQDPKQIQTSQSSDLFGEDDPDFLDALSKTPLPTLAPEDSSLQGVTVDEHETLKRKRTSSPAPEDDASFPQKSRLLEFEESYGDETIYGASKFHGWGEYMHRKRAKLSIQNDEMEANSGGKKSEVFKGLALHVRTVLILCLRSFIVTVIFR